MNSCTIFSASPSRTNRAGIQSMFALLCSLDSFASSSPQQIAARIPLCLFAVIATPLALPQRSIPNDASPLSTALATGWAKSG